MATDRGVGGRRIGLIGVPSSAGAHWPGQENAPSVLRDTGLVRHLTAAGLTVIDHGDLPRVRMRPDRHRRHPQNLDRVIQVIRWVADAVVQVVRAREIPMVIGGDCTIELGVVSGFLRAGIDPALLYFDGGPDLRTPADNPTGILDSMGVAHMIGEAGADPDLANVGPRSPLLSGDRIIYFGDEPNPTSSEGELVRRREMQGYAAGEVCGRPVEAATEALRRIQGLADHFLIHFDVDVVDFTDFPMADVPQHNAGLTFADAMAALATFTSSPSFAGLTVTEFNPDHLDEEGEPGERFVESIARALTPPK